MRKPFLLAAFCCTILAFADSKPLLDSTIYIDDINDVKTKTYYAYDNKGRESKRLVYSWDKATNSWLKRVSKEYTYYANNDLESELKTTWDSEFDNLVSKELIEYTYAYTGKPSVMVKKDWDNGKGSWKNQTKIIYTYNSSKNRMSEITQTWSDNDWVDESKVSFTRDDNENITEQIFFKFKSNDWQYVGKDEYTFNGDYKRSAHYNWINNIWVIERKEESFYEDGFVKTYIIYTYDSEGKETIDHKSEFQLDDRGNRIQTDTYLWDEIEEIWTLSRVTTCTYNDNNEQLTEKDRQWDKELNAWRDGDYIEWQYDDNTGVLLLNRYYSYVVATQSLVLSLTNIYYYRGIEPLAIKAPILNYQLPNTNKIIRNGQLYILRDGKTYSVQGQEIK